MRLRRYLSIVIVCLLATVSTAARRAGNHARDGVKLGDAFVLHLGLGLEFDWDSNVFYQSDHPLNSFELRLTPRFALTNQPRLGGRQFLLDFHGGSTTSST